MLIEYKLTHSRRKTIGIYISAEQGVEVRAPRHVSARQAHEFVVEKQAWIEKQLNKLANQPQRYEPNWEWGGEHYFLGEPQVVHCQTGLEADFVLPGKPSDSREQIEKRIASWYRAQATEVFNERHQFWVARMASMNLPDSFVELRQMKRRWGSCRKNGKITLNTHLVKYPLECVDVVIVHELCHLLEFNHSARFYTLMSQNLPQWKIYDALLNQLSLEY